MRKLIVLLMVLGSMSVFGQDFSPATHTITIVCPTAPGGPTDVSARIFADFLNKKGYAAIVLNKPGANRTLGGDYVASVPGNNYTLLIGAKSDSVVSPLMKPDGIQYNENTFSPIGMIGFNHLVFVINKDKVKSRTVKDFIVEYNNSKTINFGTIGAAGQLAIYEFLKNSSNTPVIANYKSSSAVLVDLINGSIQVGAIDIGSALPMIQSEKIVPLALGSGRTNMLPGVPAISEIYPGYNHVFWTGIFGPKNMSPSAIKFYSTQLIEMHKDPQFESRFVLIDVSPVTMNSAEFDDFYKGQIKAVLRLLNKFKVF